jgi:hypothetical protein
MGTNVKLVDDVINYFDKSNKSGLLFMLDFQKAFDSLDRVFLYKTLKWYGFGDDFIHWITVIYNSSVAYVKNNGFLSDKILIEQGIKQGCPVSSLLFVLAVEILAIKVRADERIDGYQIKNFQKKIKIAQYADDAILFLKNEKEVEDIFSITEQYSKVSGLNLNKDKCEGFWIGSSKYRQENCNLFGIKWPDQIKYLGIYFGHNKEENYVMNWQKKIRKIENLLNKWSKRELSLFGKIQVIKSIAIPQITLVATILPTPKNVIKDINKILYKFLWNSTEKIKRLKTIKKVNDGGLNMTDLDSYICSLKANWINRLRLSDPNTQCWAQIPTLSLETLCLFEDTLTFNLNKLSLFPEVNQLAAFYKEVILSYSKVFSNDKETFLNEIQYECIWGNQHILSKEGKKKKVIFFKNWIKSKIIHIKDLKFTDGILDENFVYSHVRNKQNIYAEIAILKNALLPYRNILRNNNLINANHKHNFHCSKQFYEACVEKKTKNVVIINDVSETFDIPITESNNFIFTRKVVHEKEIKLKEFNFKVLHNILPCNYNLNKWKIKENKICDVCTEEQNIPHLLFHCRYVRPIWDKVDSVFNIEVNFEMILGLGNHSMYNNILTIVSFLIYKEWVLLSLENKKRNQTCELMAIKAELKLRYQIYDVCKSILPQHKIFLERLIENM